MNEEQLDKTFREVLENHRKWFRSKGEEGEKIDLLSVKIKELLCKKNENKK